MNPRRGFSSQAVAPEHQICRYWPYSVIAALEPGRTSWTAVLDAIRLGTGDDETAVTAAQVREVIAGSLSVQVEALA